jgi:hypothetical protein
VVAIVTDAGSASREQGNFIIKDAASTSMAFWGSPFRWVGGWVGGWFRLLGFKEGAAPQEEKDSAAPAFCVSGSLLSALSAMPWLFVPGDCC